MAAAVRRADAAPVVWAPQPGSQQAFLAAPFFEVLYEGTRGPGKTDALLMSFAQFVGAGFGAAWKGVLFREEYKELADVITKSKKWFRQIFPAARFLESKGDYKWVFSTGEELLFRAGKTGDDYWDYHGHEYPWLGFEELTKWASPDFYEAMQSCCRSTMPNMPRMIRATTNPFGRGHNWVKAKFIDPAPPGVPFIGEHGRMRCRIRGYLAENKILLRTDPEYINTLKGVKDPNKRKAWLDGDWDIVAGGMFDDIWDRDRHVLPRFDIPQGWRIDRSFDWGSSKPFSVGWWAESDGTEAKMADGTTRNFPRGTVFRIAEWYGWNGEPNQGLRMLATDIAAGIKKREAEMSLAGKVDPGPADSAIFDTQNGVCIADDMERIGISWERADKGPGSRRNGWEKVRDMLDQALKHPAESPGLFVFDSCRQFIRTVPVLPRSEKDMDDVDSDAEDHIADETRYRVTMPARKATSHRFRM